MKDARLQRLTLKRIHSMNCCFFYPQITQITQISGIFLKDLSDFTLIEINVVKSKIISLICGNLRNLRIKKAAFVLNHAPHRKPLKKPTKSFSSFKIPRILFSTHAAIFNECRLDTPKPRFARKIELISVSLIFNLWRKILAHYFQDTHHVSIEFHRRAGRGVSFDFFVIRLRHQGTFGAAS
jgi:hypothetical protein